MNPSQDPTAPTDPPAWLDALAAALEPFRGTGVVLAVSGGGDSVALLVALASLNDQLAIRLSVATFDHSTRAGESARDAAFVADLAVRLGLPCDLGGWRAERSGGFEANARRARYAWLAEVARGRGASAVVTGHTRDDQAETILHRIVRGTGLRGLGGMAPTRPLGPGVMLVRPFLGVTRADLRTYLIGVGQTWREDPTNDETARTRSRLRHDLLPLLARDYNPGVVEALVRLGSLAADASGRLDQRAARLLRRLTIARGPDGISLDWVRLARLDPGDRLDLIRAAWRDLGWPEQAMSHAQWVRLAHSVGDPAPGRVVVGSGIEAMRLDRVWTLRRVGALAGHPSPEPVDPRGFVVPIPGSVAYGGGQLHAILGSRESDAGGAGRNQTSLVERLDADQLVGPCIIRAPIAGDRFDPLGLEGRSRAVADLLRGRKVPRHARGAVPVVADAAGIVWVVGHRIAHRMRRTEATRRVLELRWESLLANETG